MGQYFAMDYHGAPFVFFSVHHLAALGAVVCICLLLTLFRNRFTEARRSAFRYSAAALLIVNETAFHIWNISLLKVVFWVNVYFITVTIINMLIGSNYMYTAHKLETPTLLDYLGPWPLYILSVEILGLAVCALLYAPFLVKDRILKRG